MTRRAQTRRSKVQSRRRLVTGVLAVVLGIAIGLVIAGVPNANSVRVDTPLITLDTVVARPATSTSAIAVPTSETTTTTSMDVSAATSSPSELPERSTLTVVVANGARIEGAAGGVVRELENAGYGELLAVNATRSTETMLYVAAGFEAVGERLMADLEGIEVMAMRPLAESPELSPQRDGDLVLVIGRP